MTAEIFVDTNILYYANTDSDDPRHERARRCVENLWATPGRAAISVQVMQELHVNLIRKAKLSTSSSAARVSHYLVWHVIDNDRRLLKSAFEIQARWRINFWDSLIVTAAQRSGAPTLWSEDLSDGQDYGGVVVVNPLQRRTKTLDG